MKIFHKPYRDWKNVGPYWNTSFYLDVIKLYILKLEQLNKNVIPIPKCQTETECFCLKT